MKREKGFTLWEVVLSLVIVLAVVGMVFSIGQMVKNRAETVKNVRSAFHVYSFLEEAEQWCIDNGEGTDSVSRVVDGERYVIDRDCSLIKGNLYEVSISVCDSSGRCRNEESFITRQ